MDDVIKVAAFVGTLVGLGVGAYAGVTVISILKRRYDAPAPALPPEELELMQARLAGIESLEARVNELEERVDFAERLVARHHESERLSPGPPLDHS